MIDIVSAGMEDVRATEAHRRPDRGRGRSRETDKEKRKMEAKCIHNKGKQIWQTNRQK